MAIVAASPLAAPAQGVEPQAKIVVDPAARLLDGDAAGEAWDVSARFDGGGHFFLRFWVTNEGPGSHTGLAMGWFVAPDGKVTSFRYGRERARWESAADGRFLRVASAVLDLRPPAGSVEIDTDKGGMKIYLRFDMPPSPPPICARREGDAGFDVLRLQQDSDGIAWVAGMAAPLAANGTVDITHAWGPVSEIETLLRRIDVSGRDGDVAFFATTRTPPKDRNRATSCIAVVDGGRKIHESQTVTVDVAPTALVAKEGSYPVPASVSFQAEAATLTMKPERELLRVNPLDIVPQPFRMLLGLRSSPRRAWAESAWTLHVSPAGGKAIERSGRGVTAVTYTNPW